MGERATTVALTPRCRPASALCNAAPPPADILSGSCLALICVPSFSFLPLSSSLSPSLPRSPPLQQFHSDLPSTPVYEFGLSAATATVPGPTMVAASGVAVKVRWVNAITDSTHLLPVDTSLMAPDIAANGVPFGEEARPPLPARACLRRLKYVCQPGTARERQGLPGSARDCQGAPGTATGGSL